MESPWHYLTYSKANSFLHHFCKPRPLVCGFVSESELPISTKNPRWKKSKQDTQRSSSSLVLRDSGRVVGSFAVFFPLCSSLFRTPNQDPSDSECARRLLKVKVKVYSLYLLIYGLSFLPLDKQSKISGCNICILAVEAAAVPNARNNVFDTRGTHKPKVTCNSKTNMVHTHFTVL